MMFDPFASPTPEPEFVQGAGDPKPELEVIEVIPEPKLSRARRLAAVGALSPTAMAFVSDTRRWRSHRMTIPAAPGSALFYI